MTLQIIQYGEPVLRKKGRKVARFDARLVALANAMLESMQVYDGIGLAAQQVGEPIKLCLVDMRVAQRREVFKYIYDGKRPPLELLMPLVLINPEVEFLGKKETVREEGCLSFPEILGEIIRPETIRVKFQDLQGIGHTLECNGLLSRVIQHEVDHLNGILFIDHMERKALKKIESRLKMLKKNSLATLKKNRENGR